MKALARALLAGLAALVTLVAAAKAAATSDSAALTAPLTAAEREQLVRDFCDFARWDTESRDEAPPERVPSTEGQRELNKMISERLKGLRVQGLLVEVDDLGCLHAIIPGKPGAPAVAMLAHVDTSPQFTGKGVEPVVHREWNGRPITLPRGGLTLDPSEMPALQRVAALNDTIITASGDTLLGADDKSGVALLVAVARRLLSLPPEQRGATVEIVFNTDEEIGLRSAAKLNYITENIVAG
jgi:tripeptide aminopeptidase